MEDYDFSNMNITIVGLGLIGGSMAKSIRKNIKVKNIWAVDVDMDILKLAESEGVIDKGYFDGTPFINSDIVFFCTYPGTTADYINNNMNKFKQNAIITDTSGIKEAVIKKINFTAQNGVEFIGGHPMTGNECIGYEYSNDLILKGAEYILTPDEKTSFRSIKVLTRIIKLAGFEKITFMSPEFHDKRIAFTSQLPHIIACALMNNYNMEKGFDCIGGSFKDMTRVADINYELWCELFNENKCNLMSELRNFMLDINDIYDILRENDTKRLENMMKISSLRRKEMST